MVYQNVFILGASGNVGSELVRQIYDDGDVGDSHANPTRVLGLASSRKILISDRYSGLDQKKAFEFSKNPSQRKYRTCTDLYQLQSILSGLGIGQHIPLTFVDVTARNDKTINDFHKTMIETRPLVSFVTANKNPLAFGDSDFFQKLVQDVNRYKYSCSVMAGAAAISQLQRLRDQNDAPTLISGCFSGTLGYICTELEKGRKFSEIVSEAKKQGYTEPHPRDDLNGLDVARKILILARTSGYAVNMDDILREPFIPVEYLKEGNVDTFLGNLQGLDHYFTERVKSAADSEKVLRYVAKMTADRSTAIPQVVIEVKLEEVPKKSALGQLEGTLNKITAVSRYYPAEKPYVLEARGAGRDITAFNIRNDLLDLLPTRRLRQ